MCKNMSAIRRYLKSCIVLALGTSTRPRVIIRGPASGYRICVSPAENLSYLLGTAEPHLQNAIRRYVREGDTVYDIGANIGYVSLSLSKKVGPTGSVIAFEPLPANIQILRRNIDINDIDNIRLLDYAASDRFGEAVIRTAENPATASLVWHRGDTSASEISIKTVTVDGLVESGELRHPTFVKIDVEGAEGMVLQGMHRTIASAQPVLFVECSELGRETVWRMLQGFDYKCQSAVTERWITAYEEYRHSDFLWHPPR
jgi:FkbM family methyltransferase